jgi:hypothetical protein
MARENKGRVHLWAVSILYAAAFVATCFVMWKDDQEAARLRYEAAELRNEDNKWKSLIGAKLGDEQMTQNYVNIVRTYSQALIREKTGTAVDRYCHDPGGETLHN